MVKAGDHEDRTSAFKNLDICLCCLLKCLHFLASTVHTFRIIFREDRHFLHNVWRQEDVPGSLSIALHNAVPFEVKRNLSLILSVARYTV